MVKAMKVCFTILGSFLDKTFDSTSSSRSWNHVVFINQNFRMVSNNTVFVSGILDLRGQLILLEYDWNQLKPFHFKTECREFRILRLISQSVSRLTYHLFRQLIYGCWDVIHLFSLHSWSLRWLRFESSESIITCNNDLLTCPFQYLMRKSKVNQNHPQQTKTCFGTPTTAGKII